MMSPAERLFWERANQRAAGFQPDIQKAILRGFEIIRESLSESELVRIVTSGRVDELISQVFSDSILDRAFIPLRQRIREATERSVKYVARELPGHGRIDGQLAVTFDYLNPKVIDAVRALDTKVIQTLKDDVRETVRAYVENGLRDGVSVARQLRTVIGLAPNQEAAVRNFEKMLAAGDREALTRALRDRRFDSTLTRLLGPDGAGLSETQVTSMTDAYRRRMVAFNAETNARTASLDAMKLGQRLSWESAIDRGIVDGDRLFKRWSGVLDDRERPEHVALEGETVPWDQPYSNGEMQPGASTWNCRCISIFSRSPV